MEGGWLGLGWRGDGVNAQRDILVITATAVCSEKNTSIRRLKSRRTWRGVARAQCTLAMYVLCNPIVNYIVSLHSTNSAILGKATLKQKGKKGNGKKIKYICICICMYVYMYNYHRFDIFRNNYATIYTRTTMMNLS